MHYTARSKIFIQLNMSNWFKVLINSFKSPYIQITINISTQDVLSKQQQQIDFRIMVAPCSYLKKYNCQRYKEVLFVKRFPRTNANDSLIFPKLHLCNGSRATIRSDRVTIQAHNTISTRLHSITSSTMIFSSVYFHLIFIETTHVSVSYPLQFSRKQKRFKFCAKT